jgi:hypothetical protein
MATPRPSPPPTFPVPPKQYEQRYFDALIQALNYALQAINNPGPKTMSALTVTGLIEAVDDTAAEAAGVPLNGIYKNSGVLQVREV